MVKLSVPRYEHDVSKRYSEKSEEKFAGVRDKENHTKIKVNHHMDNVIMLDRASQERTSKFLFRNESRLQWQ